MSRHGHVSVGLDFIGPTEAGEKAMAAGEALARARHIAGVESILAQCQCRPELVGTGI
jgi:hypothetical protein